MKRAITLLTFVFTITPQILLSMETETNNDNTQAAHLIALTKDLEHLHLEQKQKDNPCDYQRAHSFHEQRQAFTNEGRGELVQFLADPYIMCLRRALGLTAFGPYQTPYNQNRPPACSSHTYDMDIDNQ